MYEFVYRTEINVSCLLILLWMAFRSQILSDKQTLHLMFIRVIVGTVFIIAIDTAMIFVTERAGQFLYVLNWILNIFYYSLTSVVAYYWVAYVIYYIYGNIRYHKALNIVCSLLIILNGLLTVSSPFTHFIFYVDPLTNATHTGSLFFVQSFTTYGMFTFAAFMAFFSFFQHFHKPSYYHRYVTFFSFIFYPLAGGVLHAFFPDANVVWQALTLALLLVYTELQFDFISRDSLTGLNNRRSFDQKLKMIEDYNEDVPGCQNHIFMLDINFFKDINDKFGHPEGDRALITTAELLKRILGSTNAFLSRYGGDEFAIIYYCSAEEAGRLRIKLYTEFDDFNKTHTVPYRLSVSAGYAPVCGSGTAAIKEAVQKADAELYKEKTFMHEAIKQLRKTSRTPKSTN